MPATVIEILSNTKCRTRNVPRKAAKAIDEALSMAIEGAFFTGAVSAAGWDGKKHFYDIDSGKFPRGLLERVKEMLVRSGVEYEVLDQRPNKPPAPKMNRVRPDMLQGVRFEGDYAYQLDVIKKALAQEVGILWLATNAGKTEIACGIMHVLRECTTLFLVGKKGLLLDARKRIAERLGMVEAEVGIIGAGRFKPAHITVATVQALARALPRKPKRGGRAALSPAQQRKRELIKAYLQSVQLLFPDECHHTRSKSWFKVTQLCDAPYRFALSGTPYGSGNGLMVEAASGPVIERIRNAELIALGVSAKPTIEMTEVAEPQIEEVRGQLYDDVYKEGIVTNTARNTLIAEDVEEFASRRLPCLVLIRQLWQGDLIGTMLQVKGVHYKFLHGETPQQWIDQAVQEFKDGTLPCIIASAIFDEGKDVPAIKGLVVADAGKSLRATLQKLGRALRRKHKGENVVEVRDYSDLTHKWLAKHSYERIRIYEDEGFDVRALSLRERAQRRRATAAEAIRRRCIAAERMRRRYSDVSVAATSYAQF